MFTDGNGAASAPSTFLLSTPLQQLDHLAPEPLSDLPQATLALDAAAGQRVGLSARVGDGPAVLLCSLREGGQESCNLDIVLDSYSEFSVTGGAAVHLAGYYMPEYEGARRGGPPSGRRRPRG